MRINRSSFVATVIVSLSIGARFCAADAEMDLATLTAAVRSQLSSISSIDVKYRKEVKYRKSLPGMPASDPDYLDDIQDLEWAEQGEYRLFSTVYAPKMKRDAYSLSFDGAKGYDYTWDPTGQHAGRLVIRSETNRGYWSAHPPYFIGRRVLNSGPCLLDLIASSSAVLIGTEIFAGRRCWKVVRRGLDVLGGPLQFFALLDADHDYLPAQIDFRHAESDTNEYPNEPYRKKAYTTWTIDEFMRVTDMSTGAERWFPKSVTLEHLLDKHAFTVTSVTLNDPIPVEHFRPNPRDGTAIQDLTAPVRPKSYIAGGNPASDALVQRAARGALSELRSRETPSASASSVDARPRRRAWAAYLLFGSSILVCAISVLFWFRANRK